MNYSLNKVNDKWKTINGYGWRLACSQVTLGGASRSHNSTTLSLRLDQQVVYMIFFSSALTETFWEVISVPESKAYRYVDTKGEQFVRYTRYKLCRIYPAGYRIDSSNPNPQAFWNCGCQLGKNIFITLSCVLLKNEALVRLQHNLQDFIVRLNFSRYRSLGL